MTDVTDNAAQSRYELMTDGHLSVADYRKDGKTIAITHVEVPTELRGRGVAAQLMAGVVEDAKQKQMTIIPVCSYAVSYLQRHPV